MLIALYNETTSQRTERAAASIGRACEAIVREIHLPLRDGTAAASATPNYLSSVMRALEPFAGVEGGDLVIEDTHDKMHKAVDHLKGQFGAVRTISHKY